MRVCLPGRVAFWASSLLDWEPTPGPGPGRRAHIAAGWCRRVNRPHGPPSAPQGQGRAGYQHLVCAGRGKRRAARRDQERHGLGSVLLGVRRRFEPRRCAARCARCGRPGHAPPRLPCRGVPGCASTPGAPPRRPSLEALQCFPPHPPTPTPTPTGIHPLLQRRGQRRQRQRQRQLLSGRLCLPWQRGRSQHRPGKRPPLQQVGPRTPRCAPALPNAAAPAAPVLPVPRPGAEGGAGCAHRPPCAPLPPPARCSNYGAKTVQLAAPGAQILSTWITRDVVSQPWGPTQRELG